MADKRKIVFRADAGPTIGYGHYIRSLALADMLKQDFDCAMFTQTPTAYQLQEAKGICPVVALPSDNSKFEKFFEYLHGDEIVVLDNYFFDTDYQSAIKSKGCKLVCLDGMLTKHYVADIVLNQALDLSSKDFSVETYTKVLTGLEYVLLRRPFYDECNNAHYRYAKNERLEVAISFGGADPLHLLPKYAELLSQMDCVETIYAIVGDAYEPSESIEKVQYVKNLSASQLVELYRTIDVAVLPSSTILKEALACRVPVISGYFVDNQIKTYNSYLEHQLIVGIGDFTAQETSCQLRKVLESGSYLYAKPECSGITADIPSKYIEIFKAL